MEQATKQDFSNATELADYLSTKGMPFREAHEVVGKLVLQCVQKNCYLTTCLWMTSNNQVCSLKRIFMKS